jgi:hypothetical protein
MKTIWFLLLLCLFVYPAHADDSCGRLEVSTEKALAGSLQEITFTYTLGEEMISTGGGIRFEYPVAYAETEFLFWSRPQADEADLLGYVTGQTSTGAEGAVRTYGIAGGIFQYTLKEGSLKKGDHINVTYKGLVQSLARDFTIRAQVRSKGDQAWQKVCEPPKIKILPQKGETVVLTSPADLEIGQSFNLSAVVLDRFGNLATGYRGSVTFESTDKSVVLPPSYTFNEEDAGKHTFRGLVYGAEGFQKITAEASDDLKVSYHYSYLSNTGPTLQRYFGDTHFHTGTGTRNRGFFGLEPVDGGQQGGDVNTLSLEDFQQFNSGGDHRGNFTKAQEAYYYAREVTRLDFASSSEHDVILFDQEAWDLSQQITDEFYEPGTFTTFFAYEWTPGITHHIILYRERGLEVFDRRAHPDLPSLWAAFDKQDKPVLCIPHLTWNFDNHTNWAHVNNTYRRLGEIYSLWNGRFLVQPGDEPQRFELGKDNNWSFQHAWHSGHKIGVVGSTDNHLGQPGANNYTIYTQHTGGLAVALSEANNREKLWEALENRRTYATTGTRIYLDFTVNGFPVGSEIQSSKNPEISGRVGGTNKLGKVEVVKYENGEYKVIHEVSPDTEVLEFSVKDNNFNVDCFYYLRVSQVSEVPGRLWSFPTNEMAWSSPIWVEMQK